MLKTVTALGILTIGLLEALGFLVYYEYMLSLGHPIVLSSVPVFQLPIYALPAYLQQPAVTFGFLGIMLAVAYSRSLAGAGTPAGARPYISVVVSQKEQHGHWYHVTRMLSFASPDGMSVLGAAFQFFVVTFFLGYSILGALTYGQVLASASLEGRQLGPTLNGFQTRSSIRFLLKPGLDRQFGLAFIHANDIGALTLLDQQGNLYRVTVISNRPRAAIDGGRRKIYTIDSKDIFGTVLSVGQVQQAKPKSRLPERRTDWWMNLLQLAPLALGFAFIAIVIRYFFATVRERSDQVGTLRRLTPEDIEVLQLPSTDAWNIAFALRRNASVYLTMVDGAMKTHYYISPTMYPGLALSLTPGDGIVTSGSDLSKISTPKTTAEGTAPTSEPAAGPE